jgi:penicillin-binding protein 1A
VGFDQPRTIMRNGFAGDIAVPMWASFMKTATRNHKPQYFRAPAGISTATVCRLSGKLAADGCQDVEVVDARGNTTRRSMAYTEYFARNTAPDESCDLHQRRNFFGTVASIFREDGEASRPRADDAAVVHSAPAGTVPAATAGQTASTAPVVTAVPEEEAPRKKRGFWSRVFGIGRDNDDDKDRRDNKNQRNKDDEDR